MSENDIRERLSDQQSAFFAIIDTCFCAAFLTMEKSFEFSLLCEYILIQGGMTYEKNLESSALCSIVA